MAKKEKGSTKTRSLTGQRQLSELIPPCDASFNGLSNAWEIDASVGLLSTLGPSWSVTATAPQALYYETRLDLSSLVIDDLTLAPMAVALMDPGVYYLQGATSQYRVLDIISSERLNIEAVADNLVSHNSAPSMAQSQIDYTSLQFGRFRLMMQNANLSQPLNTQVIRDVQFGSLEPTANDRLWLYRIVIPSGTFSPDDAIRIPSSRFVIQALVFKEEELPYMMRLKRSFELAQ